MTVVLYHPWQMGFKHSFASYAFDGAGAFDDIRAVRDFGKNGERHPLPFAVASALRSGSFEGRGSSPGIAATHFGTKRMGEASA